jgi:hypothetical protein
MHRFLLLTFLCFGLLGTKSSMAQGLGGPTFEQRVTVEAVRNRINRAANQVFDERIDRISFTVKFKNSDTKTAFNGCKAEFFVFAQNMQNKRAYQLLGIDRADITLAPLASQEFSTEEVTTRYDPVGVVFGSKYDGWVLIVRDATGKLILKKSSTSQWLPVADKMSTLTVGNFYGRDLKELKGNF